MAKLRDCLETACIKLAGSPTARLEAEVLLAHALESPRSFLYANPELDLPGQRIATFRKLVRRRIRGEPMAYITGTREFWSLPLRIEPGVLIPRHETELLVETALQHIPRERPQRIAELGTGSGAIALAIASERLSCEIHATDVSEHAIVLAKVNAQSLGADSISFHTGSWCEPLSGTFDMIISNPPYVAADDPHLEQGDCRFEPLQALSPGLDPMIAIRAIAGEARPFLNPGGWLLLEHGTGQGVLVREILQKNSFTTIRTLRDLAGHERVTQGQAANDC